MLPAIPLLLQRPADISRPVADLAAWKAATMVGSPTSYFYGYWFSHWRA
jgi:hypothetical protein